MVVYSTRDETSGTVGSSSNELPEEGEEEKEEEEDFYVTVFTLK